VEPSLRSEAARNFENVCFGSSVSVPYSLCRLGRELNLYLGLRIQQFNLVSWMSGDREIQG